MDLLRRHSEFLSFDGEPRSSFVFGIAEDHWCHAVATDYRCGFHEHCRQDAQMKTRSHDRHGYKISIPRVNGRHFARFGAENRHISHDGKRIHMRLKRRKLLDFIIHDEHVIGRDFASPMRNKDVGRLDPGGVLANTDDVFRVHTKTWRMGWACLYHMGASDRARIFRKTDGFSRVCMPTWRVAPVASLLRICVDGLDSVDRYKKVVDIRRLVDDVQLDQLIGQRFPSLFRHGAEPS